MANLFLGDNVRLILSIDQIREILRNLPTSESQCLSAAHWKEVCALYNKLSVAIGEPN